MRRWVIAVAALVAAPLAVLVAVAVLGVPISAAPWRDRIAAVATDALGRPVTLEGPVELVLGLRAALRVGGIRIANPPGFATPAFAELGAAHAEVDLWPALGGRLRIRSLDAADVRVWLERAADGRRNWVFDALAGTPEEDEHDTSGVAVRIGRLSLRNLAVEHHAGGRVRYFDLDTLDGEGVWSRPVKLAVRGRVEKRFPYVLTLEGGPARVFYRGEEPWPFALDLEFAGTRMHASGTANAHTGETEFFFGLGTENLAEVERLLQTPLPKVGVTSLAARVTAGADRVELAGISGVMGVSELAGHLKVTHAMANTGARPRVTGELALATLDLRPFLADDGRPHDALAYDAVEKQPLDFSSLGIADADVHVRVARWLGLPGEVRDAKLDVRIEDARLSAPLEATVAEVVLAGRLDLDGAAAVPSLALELGAKRSPLGRLAEVLTGLPGIQGNLGRFDLKLAGRGETLGALARDVEVKLAVAAAKLSYGNVAGGRPVDLVLDALDVTIPRGQRLRGTARGALAGERVTAELRGGDVPAMLRSASSPIDLQVRGAGTTLALSGVLARPEATRGTDLAFRLDGRRAGDLAGWLGTAPGANAPVAVQGHARIESDEWHLDELRIRLGRSEIVVDAHRTGIGAKPIIVAAVRSPLIDVTELERLFPAGSPPPQARGAIEIPILPHGIDLADADIGIGLERVVFARGELANAGVGLRLRGGRMEPSPFGASFAGVPFTGTVALDLRSDIPELAVAMAAEKVDLGAMLRTMRIADDLDAGVDSLKVQLIGRGRHLVEMLERSSLEAKLEGGAWRIRGPAGRRVLADIRLKEAYASAPPGKALTVRIDGTLDSTPIAIRVTSAALAALGPDAKFAPFSATAEAAGARLALDGRVALPISQTTAVLKLNLSGDRLDTLSGLARTALPPWGPWSIAGPVTVTAAAYEVPDLDVRVGSSRLGGRARLDLARERPRLEMQVAAPRVQLDDFKLDGWSPVEAKSVGSMNAEPASAEALREQAKGAAAQVQALASADVLARFDADLDVEVAEVRSGADRMGDGRLRAQVTEGRVFLGPAEVNIPGGTVRLSLLYEPSAAGVQLRAGAYVENFDYGILARRIRPDTPAEGTFSMNLELGSRAPSLAKVMEHANGRIDVAVWPRKLSSGVFDLWAVNVFLALLPEIDPSGEPVVNCAVTRFDLKDGKLTDDAILVDTSRMRVTGKGGADFRDETLAFRLQPQAKSAQLFSLATPVDVTGTLTNFHVGPSAGDVLLTLGRFFTSIVVVPFQWLTEGPIPRDGADVCTDPLRPQRERRR